MSDAKPPPDEEPQEPVSPDQSSSDQPPLDHVPADEPPQDHVEAESNEESQAQRNGIGEHLKSRSAWLRLLFMVLFIALWFISRLVVFAVMGLQVLFLLFSGKPDARLAAFGGSLAAYSYEVVAYLTFASETQPFPFSDWPDGSDSSAPSSEDK